MAIIEGLFPVDPIGAFDKIKQNYLRYFKTTYKFAERFDGDELDALKNEKMSMENSLFHQYPYCEIIPEYVSEGKSLSQLINENDNARDKLPDNYSAFIEAGLMEKDYFPYKHQFDSLLGSFVRGENIVITSGTGSGKTESFMLPLFASLLKEMENWPVQNGYENEWYCPKDGNNVPKDQYDAAYQRGGESAGRSAAIRALIMYPMNALVEDQIARLRRAIDSDNVRDLLDREFGHNRIFFGQYNSSTIGRKSLDGIVTADREDKKRCLKSLDRYAENYSLLLQREGTITAEKSNANQELEAGNPTDARREELYKIIEKYDHELDRLKEARYISPRLSAASFSGEMVTRWDMQAKAPDILITNFSMLSAMMMRSSERKMIEDTRKWFEIRTDADVNLTDVQKEERKKERVFHLILDELHLYRGTAGTEVAYLIRSFLNEIGVPPVIENENGLKIPNPQLRIIASSASLDDPQDFLKQFFGVFDEENPQRDLFRIIEGSDYEPNDLNLTLKYDIFKVFAEKDEEGGLRYIDDPSCRDEIITRFLSDLHDNEVDSISAFIDKYEEQIFHDIKKVCRINDPDSQKGVRYVPKSLKEFIDELFHSEDAIRGFFVFRADEEVRKRHLPRIRFHQFFKYVEGLWGELTDSIQNDHQKVIESVMYTPKELITRGNSVHKVLELLRCECCGSLFIGGNKRIKDANSFYLTLNYPELTEIPNRTPTPMVQNKRYSDYAVFWPEEDADESGRIADFVPIGADGAYSETATGFHAEWKRAYLNPVDGEVQIQVGPVNQYPGWIKGYTYVLRQNRQNANEKEVMALPCLCPNCNKDYRLRKYTKSPIRSFRSGIDRSNQWICKELFYQLPKDNRKLIGFSDSRQDAAEQAALIANEHYRDMVRLLFYECISADGPDYFTPLRDTIILLITQGIDNNTIQGLINGANGVTAALRNQLAFFAQQRNTAAIAQMGNDNHLIPLSDLVSSGNQILGGQLVSRLLDLGINPAGPAYADQTINGLHWSSAYDFMNHCANQQIGNNADSVRRRLSAAVFHNSFGQFMKVNSEEAGLGYIGILLFDENAPDYVSLRTLLSTVGVNIREFLNAYVRVLGDHYRYDDPDSIGKINNNAANPNEYNNWSSFDRYNGAAKKPIRKLADILQQAGESLTANNLGNLVHSVLELCGIHEAELKLDNLGFYKVDENDSYYECPRCHRVHLHRGMGFCTNTACLHALPDDPSGQVGQLHEKNYISYDILMEQRAACRIHTEELTGQTDDQAERLLDFKGIILNDPDHSSAREIDMINVTTTMEVGVDIGGLLAVFQGNMPPTRYNYQQRVGRGGRRGQPFSTAITFCRGRSHDTYYYSDGIEEMLGSKPKSPKLSIRPTVIDQNVMFNDEIVKRVILKQVLHIAMKDHIVDINEIDPTDIHGEFGLIKNWNTDIRPFLISWIDHNHLEIEKVIHYYLDQYNEGGHLDQYITRMIDWFEGPNIVNANVSSFILAVDSAVTTSTCAGLGQCLAEAGFLPIYGMPSNSRNFYHGYSNGGFRTIDRSVEQSITEFAPGSVKTKDHGYYTSAGLTSSFEMSKYTKDRNGDLVVDDNRWDALELCYGLEKDLFGRVVSIDQTKDDISNIEGRRRIPLVIPKAYRTNQIFGNRGRKTDNDDKGSFTRAYIWADASGIMAASRVLLPNANVVYWNCGEQSRPTVWLINDNNGKYYKGKRVFFIENGTGRNAAHVYVTGDSPKHIGGNVESILNTITVFPSFLVDAPNPQNGQPVYESNGTISHSIAIGAKKVTEMICISVGRVNRSLNLSVGGITPGYVPGIMAAFYSAATLIQRVFADEMDIQPDEIEISEIKIENDIPCIYLSDALANGSGYVGMLMQEENGKTRLQSLMEKIINFEGDYLQTILKHGSDVNDPCLTSCPICLRTYQNSGYHHVLDWRLGVDLIKLMLDPNYQMGYDDLANTPYHDLEEQMKVAGKMVADNNVLVRLEFINQRYSLISNPILQQARMEMIVHPLWNHDPKKDQNYFELLRTGYETKPNAIVINQAPQADPDGPNIEFEF